MQSLWTPLFSFAVFVIVFAFGDLVAEKTKGLVSSIIIGAAVYLVGFWTKIIPASSLTDTTLPAMMSAFGIAILLVHVGTIINLEDLLKEWKTVLIALIGLVGLAAISFTLSTMLFGREYALSAASPIAGGVIAGVITNESAVAAGKPELGGFAMLVVAFQMFIGMPIASFLLKKEANKLVKSGTLDLSGDSADKKKKINLRFIPPMPKSLSTSSWIIGRVAIVAAIAAILANFTAIPGSNPTNYILNPNIAYLLFGILFCEFGFLEKNALNKANAYGFVGIALMSIVPGSFASISFKAFLGMIYPLIGTLILGSIGIAVFAAIAGKLLGYSPAMSITIGLTALIGYPGTQVITNEVTNGLDASDEEKAAVSEILLPKMLVGGFTTVTIASVVFAGIIAPMIFK
ncbi:hypothetical protein H8K20_02925 [Neobittarella massiliensis]|uniref:Na+/glutamate symporter n=1 Tax=Neobittarella massiliensis (ex Bilen et al. 2018) TaxID=2041842 RepID=A0A8J6IP74_9FIRM|nr:hypothetical protein [Neobittarella massiliensis]MBC3515348.1 hypothetical protein [Neobittarella massiliensis]